MAAHAAAQERRGSIAPQQLVAERGDRSLAADHCSHLIPA